jgi:predicted hydrocarbon binding protein
VYHRARVAKIKVKRLFELVGAKDVYVDRRACRARGDAACVFVGGWT